MASPGSFASQVPAGEDNTPRKIADLGRDIRELGPSIARSFAPVIADLQAKDVALAELVATQTLNSGAWDQNVNFALPSAWTQQASCEVTVPAGYTKIQFYAIGSVLARNDSGSTQYLMARIRRQIDGAGDIYGGTTAQQTLPTDYWGTALAPYVFNDVTASGAVHRFWLESWVGGATWTAHANHVARIEVAVTFSR